MEKEPKKPIGSENTSSFRLIAAITAESLGDPIKVISTTWSYHRGAGQTAVSYQKALNYFSVDFSDDAKWTVMKKHTNPLEAIAYHQSQIINEG